MQITKLSITFKLFSKWTEALEDTQDTPDKIVRI